MAGTRHSHIASNGTSDRLVLLKVNRWYEPTNYVWLHDTSELVAVADVFSDLTAGKRSDGPRTPKGYVLAHGRTTPAREGYDYSNSRLQGEDLNKLEESVRHRERYLAFNSALSAFGRACQRPRPSGQSLAMPSPQTLKAQS